MSDAVLFSQPAVLKYGWKETFSNKTPRWIYLAWCYVHCYFSHYIIPDWCSTLDHCVSLE